MKTFFIALLGAILGALVASTIVYGLRKNEITTLQLKVEQLESTTEGTEPTSPVELKRGEDGLQPPGGQVFDLKSHAAFFTTSDDPTSFPDSDDPIFTAASVPELIRLTVASEAGNVGDLLIYFVDAENFTGPNTEGLGYAKSTDNGKTWSEKQSVTVADRVNEGGVVDPSLVQLDDGRLRMYFFGSEIVAGDPANAEGPHIIYSAISEDGLTFTAEDGERFAMENLTDPEIIRLDDLWIMYVSTGQTTVIADSDDGLTFTNSGTTWSGGGVPGAFVDAENIVHLYGCGRGGIMTQSSNDGITFSDLEEPVAALTTQGVICDPAPVLLGDGSAAMVYKKIITEN